MTEWDQALADATREVTFAEDGRVIDMKIQNRNTAVKQGAINGNLLHEHEDSKTPPLVQMDEADWNA